MITILEETIKLWRSGQIVYGQSDCMLSVGDYITACGGIDVASAFRGTYSTQAEALTLLRGAGGPAALIDRTGKPRVAPDWRGDGAVVVFDIGAEDLLPGVLASGFVCSRLERGLIEVDPRFVVIKHAWIM